MKKNNDFKVVIVKVVMSKDAYEKAKKIYTHKEIQSIIAAEGVGHLELLVDGSFGNNYKDF